MNRSPPEWYRDPEFWEANRSFIWSDKRIEMSGVAARKIAGLLDMQPGESILDMACGFGRHSLELSKLGYSVTGIDLTPSFIEEAASKALDLGLDTCFHCIDMRDFVKPGGFENIIIMYNSFGYFSDPQDDRLVIQNCLRSLKPGGKLLLSVAIREYLMRNRSSPVFRYWHEEEDGAIRLEEALVNDDWTWNTTKWILIRGSDRREYTFGQRLYDSPGLCSLLTSAGFDGIQTFGNLSGAPFGEDSHHLVVLAQKPANQGHESESVT